ncbi:MAG: RNA polymerase sigma factor [Bryobacteraceae bacterium]|nr:RNA polymerase sigma factor [Bryobacteraceae bacterium]
MHGTSTETMAASRHDDSAIPRQATGQELDSERQNQFIAEHLKRVYLLIYRIVQNTEDAQDLTQEVFIKVLQRREQLRDRDKAAHWMSRIATNTAIDFLRRRKRIHFSDLEDISPVPAPAAENPETQVLRAESQSRLEAGFSALTDRERLALVLRDVEDMPAEEVARHLNCSKATVRSHIANARVKFRKFLERRKP